MGLPQKLVAGCFVALAVLSAVFLIQMESVYAGVSKAKASIGPEQGTVAIVDVAIPRITDTSADVPVTVTFAVQNPSPLPILVYSLDFLLYMDNKSDTRSLAQKLADQGPNSIYVWNGGFQRLDEDAERIAPGGEGNLSVTIVVPGGGANMRRLNTTFNGDYYPYVQATLRYTFENARVRYVVPFIVFYEPVEPR